MKEVKKGSLKYVILSKMASMMIACDEASFLSSKSLDTTLTFKEKVNLKLHLMACKLCRRYEKEIQALDVYIKNKNHCCSHHGLNEEQSERIQKRVMQELES